MAKPFRFDLKKGITLAIFIGVGVFVLFKGAIYHTDTSAFLKMSFNRSPLYSTFLKFFTAVFGNNFEIPIIICQYVFIVWSTSHLLRTLKQHFNTSFFAHLVIQLILLAPVVHWHFTANKLMSEALTYPLFLLVFSFSLKLFITEKLNHVYAIAIALFVLLLTRGQFIVAIPVLILIVIFITWKNKNFKKGTMALVLILVVPLATNLAERSYHKIVHGYFVNYAMSYVHMISADFYISKPSDVQLFNDDERQIYFFKVHRSLMESGLTRDQIVAQEMDDQLAYQTHFSEICNERIHEIGLSIFEEQGLDFVQQNIELNRLCKSMFVPMLKENLSVRLKLFYKNFKTTFGSAKYMLLFILLLIYSSMKLMKKDNDLFKFVTFATLLMIANNLLIAFVVHPINRYTFYFDWVIFAIIVLCLDRMTKTRLNVH